MPGLIFLVILAWAGPLFAQARYYHPAGKKVFCHEAYCFDYVSEYGQSDWTAYLLTRQAVEEGKAKRSNDFRADPEVPGGTPDPGEYRGSGYDLGHLVPAADMKWSTHAMSQTFFTSNMSPQAPSFNRGVWKRLESAVRDWAIEKDSLYVVTGPVLRKGLPAIGHGTRVAVPELYYKIILAYTRDRQEAVAFVMRNEKSTGSILDCAVTVDSVERLTGIDFFPDLPPDIEKRVEGKIDLSVWPEPERRPHGQKHGSGHGNPE